MSQQKNKSWRLQFEIKKGSSGPLNKFFAISMPPVLTLCAYLIAVADAYWFGIGLIVGLTSLGLGLTLCSLTLAKIYNDKSRTRNVVTTAFSLLVPPLLTLCAYTIATGDAYWSAVGLIVGAGIIGLELALCLLIASRMSEKQS